MTTGIRPDDDTTAHRLARAYWLDHLVRTGEAADYRACHRRAAAVVAIRRACGLDPLRPNGEDGPGSLGRVRVVTTRRRPWRRAAVAVILGAAGWLLLYACGGR